jgi:hypothetical protein
MKVIFKEIKARAESHKVNKEQVKGKKRQAMPR